MGKTSAKSSEHKENKSRKRERSKENNTRNEEKCVPESADIDINKLIEKQQEACNVIEQKKNVLVSNQLSYLEYIEMQEEIARLTELRENFQAKINALRKQRKRSESAISK